MGEQNNGIYHEKQIRELCALHALNNLLQEKQAFTKSELDEICQSLSPDCWVNPHRSPLGLGNYDVNVIMSALQRRGYEAIWFDKRKDPNCLRLDHITGFILNVPSEYRFGFVLLPLHRRHWVTVRRVHGEYFNLDSKLDSPLLIGKDEDLVKYLKQQLNSKEKELFIVTMFSSLAPRTRRLSASSLGHHHTSGMLSPRLTPRVNQLRQEECLDVAVGRETAHERELNSTMVMSQSWEDLTIVGTSPKCDSGNGEKSPKPRVGVCDPLQIHLPSLSPVCSSPSPTRMLSNKQVFSPNMWKTNLSPSPKKFTTRRSLSPIAMRPSTLGPVKRKFDLDDNEPPAKRSSIGLLMPHSRLDLTGSPLAGSLSSVGTPESVSSGDSPGGFSYRNIDSPNTAVENPSEPSTDHPMQDLNKADANPS